MDDSLLNVKAMLEVLCERAASQAPCILLLRHVDCLRSDASNSTASDRQDSSLGVFKHHLTSFIVNSIVDTLQHCIQNILWETNLSGFPVVVAASCTNDSDIPASLRTLFRHEFLVQVSSSTLPQQNDYGNVAVITSHRTRKSDYKSSNYCYLTLTVLQAYL